MSSVRGPLTPQQAAQALVNAVHHCRVLLYSPADLLEPIQFTTYVLLDALHAVLCGSGCSQTNCAYSKLLGHESYRTEYDQLIEQCTDECRAPQITELAELAARLKHPTLSTLWQSDDAAYLIIEHWQRLMNVPELMAETARRYEESGPEQP